MKHITAWLTWLLLSLLLLILPSIELNELGNPTQIGKFLAFSYICCLLFVLYLLQRFFSSTKTTIRINLIDILLLVLVIYIAVCRHLSGQQGTFSMVYYELGGLSVIYLIVRTVNPRHYLYIFLSITFAGIIQAIYGELQLHGYASSNNELFNITGSFFNPGPYAGYLINVFIIALGLYLYRSVFITMAPQVPMICNYNFKLNPIFLNTITIAALIAIMLVIPATDSRAAWVAGSVGAFFLITTRLKKIKIRYSIKGKVKWLAILFAVAVVFGIFFTLYRLKKDSADGRILVWKIASRMITDHPVTGCGFDQFKANYMNYQKEYFYRSINIKEEAIAGDVFYCFNEPLQFIIENGVIGGVLLLAACTLAFTTSSVRFMAVIRVAKAVVLCSLFFSFFSYPAYILPIKLNLMVCFAMLSTFVKPALVFPPSKGVAHLAQYGNLFLLLITLTIVYRGRETLNRIYQAFSYSKIASIYYQSEDYAASIKCYREAYLTLHNDGALLSAYGKALNMAGRPIDALAILKQAEKYYNNTIVETAIGDSYKMLGQYSNCENAYWNAWYMAPSRFYPKYLLAKLYNDMGQKGKAVKIAKELMAEKPKIPSVAITEIREELQKIIELN